MIPCKCGCGELIEPFDSRGRPHKYIRGHNPVSGRFKKGHTFTKESILKMSASKIGIPRSEETKKKISEHHADVGGDKHPMYGVHRPKELSGNWKGGITLLGTQIRNSEQYREWRISIYERDNFTCQKCGQISGKLNAHHKKYFYKILEDNNIDSLEKAQESHELWDVSNGITYCEDCHDGFPRKFMRDNYDL